MFRSKTVFVLGAGASDEVGLPIGRVLTSKISSLLNIHVELGNNLTSGDGQIYETLRRMVQRDSEGVWQNNNLIGSARHIGEAMQLATSIDTFLESFSHDRERVLLGKLGIAKAIISSERASKLASQNHNPFPIRNVTDTWYASLAQLLFSGVSAHRPQFAFDNVSFIDFNYDRCLQTFLVRALQVYFELSEAEARACVQNVPVLHPYGSLGSVFPGGPDYLPFGNSDTDLTEVADRIDTFSETVRDADLLAAIREEISQADTLVFLGFAFHEQNIQVLSDPSASVRPGRRQSRVLATTFNLSASDTSIVRGAIANMVWGQPPSGYIESSIHTHNGKCASLFSEYWRSLTADIGP